MEMSRIECKQNFTTQRIRAIKLHRTDNIGLRAKTKKLRFHRVEVVARVNSLSEDQVQRFKEQAPGCLAIRRAVLISIWNPDVRHSRSPQFPAKKFANFATGNTVLHPKLTDA